MSGFSNFAISFAIICIVAGGITAFGTGLSAAGGASIGIGWPVGSLFAFIVALAMAQIASAYPTAGGLYHWSSILGGRGWGWATAWFNLLGTPVESNRFVEIIMTRVTIPLGEDIGFLPGTEEEKMEPWMGALMDNLEVLTKSGEGGNWGRAATNDLLRNRIKIRSLNFMRGRTFLNRFVILDEAQNLTPKQMKALVTRAGPGTKLVCLGNIAQIDTPYLTEGSSGLTYVVDRFKGWDHSGHVTLMRGERSRLADHAAEAL